MISSSEIWSKCLNVSQMSIIYKVSFYKDTHTDMSRISLKNEEGAYISRVGVITRASYIGYAAAAYSISAIGLEGAIASVSSIGDL